MQATTTGVDAIAQHAKGGFSLALLAPLAPLAAPRQSHTPGFPVHSGRSRYYPCAALYCISLGPALGSALGSALSAVSPNSRIPSSTHTHPHTSDFAVLARLDFKILPRLLVTWSPLPIICPELLGQSPYQPPTSLRACRHLYPIRFPPRLFAPPLPRPRPLSSAPPPLCFEVIGIIAKTAESLARFFTIDILSVLIGPDACPLLNA